jgi:hypothetical protein
VSSASIIVIILFLYCFPTPINTLDNRSADTTSATHFLSSAFGQQRSSLPELNDEALRVELVIKEELLFPTSMVFVDNDSLLVLRRMMVM